MMLFACGIGVGLFFFGVSEPIYHYTSKTEGEAGPPNRYFADPTMPDNTVAQWALNLTLFHWGNMGISIFQIPSYIYIIFQKLAHPQFETMLYMF